MEWFDDRQTAEEMRFFPGTTDDVNRMKKKKVIVLLSSLRK